LRPASGNTASEQQRSWIIVAKSPLHSRPWTRLGAGFRLGAVKSFSATDVPFVQTPFCNTLDFPELLGMGALACAKSWGAHCFRHWLCRNATSIRFCTAQLRCWCFPFSVASTFCGRPTGWPRNRATGRSLKNGQIMSAPGIIGRWPCLRGRYDVSLKAGRARPLGMRSARMWLGGRNAFRIRNSESLLRPAQRHLSTFWKAAPGKGNGLTSSRVQTTFAVHA